MDTIDGNVMQQAAECVIHAVRDCPTIHTVTVTLNGQHGGADVIVRGLTISGDHGDNYDGYERTFEVR